MSKEGENIEQQAAQVEEQVKEEVNEQVSEDDEEQNDEEQNEEIEASAAVQTTETNIDDPLKWPDVVIENFNKPLIDVKSNIDDANRNMPWPELSEDSIKVWKHLKTFRKLIVRCITWNLCGKAPPATDDIRKLVIPLNKFHVLAVGTEECERTIAQSAVNPSKKLWEAALLEITGENYAPIRSHTLQAIHLMIFVHVSLVPFVSDICSTAVTTGLGNTMGNKGAVGIRFKIANTSYFFVNSHLAAHQNAVKERNANFERIDKLLPLQLDIQTALSPSLIKKNTETIPKAVNDADYVSGSGLASNADIVIFMGDMNYRIRGNRDIVDKLLSQNMHEVLQSNDQLTTCMKKQMVLQAGFVEPPLHFKPTYKFDVNSDVYDSGKKRRIPAWTDRILYVSKPLIATNKDETTVHPVGIECISYNADFTLRTSDHRPVYASFVVDMDICADYLKLLNNLLKEAYNEKQSAIDQEKSTKSAAIEKDPASEKIEYNRNIEFSSESQVCTIS